MNLMHFRLPVMMVMGLIALLVTGASAAHISIPAITVAAGDTVPMNIILDSVPPTDGMSGYKLTFNIADPSVCEITGVKFTDTLGGLTDSTPVPFKSGFIHWADTGELVEPGDTRSGLVLATLTVHGLSGGSTVIHVKINEFDGDGPNWADLRPTSSLSNPTVTVVSSGTTVSTVTPLAIPGQEQRPTSPGNNEKYSDLNGDGTVSSTDVSLYFNNFEWIQANEPVALFDYNKNGIIDFGDIVTLNENV